MAGQLETIRPELVRRCNAALLHGLLDDLRNRHVLNAQEVEFINESKPERANKCRELIDMVLKKGDYSCNVLLQTIREKDQALSHHLGIADAL